MSDTYDEANLTKALTLAAVSGLRASLGPALVAASENDEWKQPLAMIALGEMVAEKTPFFPSRSSLPMLIPSAMAGAYVARKVLGKSTPWASALGAVVAAGVATLAPSLRTVVRTTLGVPDALVGLAEDYLAIKYGSQAVGLQTCQLVERSGLGEMFEAPQQIKQDYQRTLQQPPVELAKG